MRSDPSSTGDQRSARSLLEKSFGLFIILLHAWRGAAVFVCRLVTLVIVRVCVISCDVSRVLGA